MHIVPTDTPDSSVGVDIKEPPVFWLPSKSVVYLNIGRHDHVNAKNLGEIDVLGF
jgi:hypothetical protein